MEEDEKKLRVLKADEQKEISSINRKLARIENGLFVLTVLMFILFCFLRIATFSAENKTDLRYFNTKRVIALTHNIWVNEYTGEIFDNEADYNASVKRYPKTKRKNLVQKMFLFLASH